MLRVHFLRHAKSDWSDTFRDDADRELAERGQRDARLMGEYLSYLRLPPELVLCSPARRTAQTWDLITRIWDGAPICEMHENLYLASQDELIPIVRGVPETVSSVMLIGHNPGMHGAAVMLTSTRKDRLVSRLRGKYPSGSLAVIALKTDHWSDVRPRSGILESVIRPKDLRQ